MRRAATVVALLASAALIAGLASAFGAREEVTAGTRDMLPVLQARDMDGRDVAPEAYRGRLLVLNVWATWCAPCRREMPSLARLHSRLDPARFAVAALAAEEDLLGVAEYMKQRDLPFPAWATTDRSASLARLAIDRIPTTLVVAPDGTVLARVIGPREWDAPTIVAELEAMADEHFAKRAGPRADWRTGDGRLLQ